MKRWKRCQLTRLECWNRVCRGILIFLIDCVSQQHKYTRSSRKIVQRIKREQRKTRTGAARMQKLISITKVATHPGGERGEIDDSANSTFSLSWWRSTSHTNYTRKKETTTLFRIYVITCSIFKYSSCKRRKNECFILKWSRKRSEEEKKSKAHFDSSLSTKLQLVRLVLSSTLIRERFFFSLFLFFHFGCYIWSWSGLKRVWKLIETLRSRLSIHSPRKNSLELNGTEMNYFLLSVSVH